MSEFKYKSITTKGMELLSKALSGEVIEFTRIEMGGGSFKGDIGSAEGLVEVKQRLPITKITRKGSQVTLSTVLRIEDITSDYDWTEIGVYAKGIDGVEILYMYGHTQNSSFISKDSLNEKLINVTVLVSNAAEVTALIDDSMVFLTLEALKDHDSDTEAHMNIKNDIEEVKTQVEKVSETVGNINIDLTPVNIHTTNTIEEAKNNINATVEASKNNANGHTTNEVNRAIGMTNSARDNINNSSLILKNEIIEYINAKTNEMINSVNSKAVKHYRASSTARQTLCSSEIYTEYIKTLGTFRATQTGTIRISANCRVGGSSGICRISCIGMAKQHGTFNHVNSSYSTSPATYDLVDFANLPIGTSLSTNAADFQLANNIAILYVSQTSYATHNSTIYVTEGDILVFILQQSGGSNAYCNSLKICYDEVIS